MNLKLNTILVVDSRKREFGSFFATVTKDARGDVVVRYASEGLVPQPRNDYENEVFCPFPILIMGTYSARSSAGHAHTVGSGGRATTVVGGLGKPFGKGGLKRLRRPIAARLMPAGCSIARWDGNSSSNQGTVNAAIEGVTFMAEFQPDVLWIEEGQSDHVSFLKLVPSKDSAYPEFYDEHQRSVFDPAIAPTRDAIFSLLPPKQEEEYGEQPTDEEKAQRRQQYIAAVVLSQTMIVAGQWLAAFQQARNDHGDEAISSAIDYLHQREHEATEMPTKIS